LLQKFGWVLRKNEMRDERTYHSNWEERGKKMKVRNGTKGGLIIMHVRRNETSALERWWSKGTKRRLCDKEKVGKCKRI